MSNAVPLVAGLVFGTALWLGLAAHVPRAQEQGDDNPIQPERHFRIDNPADLSAAEAEVIYERIIDRIVGAYRGSAIPAAAAYKGWRRYNTAPYLSATHGNRYVNNYANAVAKDYGQLPDGVSMPPGSVIVKDSFTITRLGDIFTGALWTMEKMHPGFNPESRDWRYTMVMPDATIIGTTKGEDSESVAFCIACHKTAGDERDHLFFVPREYQIEFLDPDSRND